MAKKRVAVLISGRGSNMAALIEAAKERSYPAEIALVVSNQPDAAGAARGAGGGVDGGGEGALLPRRDRAGGFEPAGCGGARTRRGGCDSHGSGRPPSIRK